MTRHLTRREFLETAAATTAAAAMAGSPVRAEGPLPRRPFGKTGFDVPILAFGCGSRFLMYRDEETAIRTLNAVIDSGITYLDTAAGYGDGESERRVGMVMKARRNEVRLATKIPESARTRDAALREVDASLKRLQTDHLDVLHLHSLGDEADLARIEAPDGAIKALYELRDQKVTRAIGMTSHTDGAVMAKAIEHNDLDGVQMAMNPARAARFEDLALPAANKKGLGIICMKVTAQEKVLGAGPGRIDIERLVRYALSLPISMAVIGMPKPEFITQNAALARAFTPLSPAEMDEVRRAVAPQSASVAAFFADHADV